MKDIVENRRRITFGKKVELFFLLLRENGFIWCASFAVYYCASKVSDIAYRWMDELRRRHGLPGMNSRALNRAIWEAWDWSAGGDEWTPTEEWKQSVITQVLRHQVPQGGDVLEIGPGGGRWTGELIRRAKQFTAVDISAACVEVCRKKFADAPNAKFLLGSGRDLADIPDLSVDAVWSFDVFVHINSEEASAYYDDFRRILRPGAVAIIHHGSAGGKFGGWRSDVTEEKMKSMLAERGFELVTSFKEWQDNGQTHKAGLYEDLITVFRKPEK